MIWTFGRGWQPRAVPSARGSEEYGEAFLEHLQGQFALALWDQRRRVLILARDRFGICPLYWTRQAGPDGTWLHFASEVKAFLASQMVVPRPDIRGIDHVFNFFAQPGISAAESPSRIAINRQKLHLQSCAELTDPATQQDLENR